MKNLMWSLKNLCMSLIKNNVEEEVEEVDDTALDEINLFTPLRLNDPTVPMLVGSTFEAFSAPLVKRNEVKSKLEFVEKLTGKQTRQAAHAANEVIKDMQVATFYPPKFMEHPSVEALTEVVNNLANHVAKRIETEEQNSNNDEDFL